MNKNRFQLTNKIAIVTGGGTGLGLGITRAFVDAGIKKVIITGRREQVLADAVKKLGNSVDYIVNDITNFDSIPHVVNEVENRFGPIDILVNNAGINQKKEITLVTNSDFNRIIQTNLNGLFEISREVSKRMIDRKRGVIINITSMAAIYGIPNVAAYTASKTGVLGLTRSMAADLSPHGIRVNAIAPGFIESPMMRKALDSDPERKKKVLEGTPMRSFGKPEDIGQATVFLASDASSFITGVNLPVDGGNSIGF